MFARPELERVAEIASRHDLVVVSDEVHAELVHPGHGHVPFASVGPRCRRGPSRVTSASKAFNLAGLRWAILHAGHEPFHDAIAALPSHYLGTPNLIAVEATDAAWTEGDEWLKAVRGLLDRQPSTPRRAPRRDTFQRSATARRKRPIWRGSIAAGWTSATIQQRRSAERGVELAAGHRFGAGGAGFVRLNFATSPVVLDAIVERMAGP